MVVGCPLKLIRLSTAVHWAQTKDGVSQRQPGKVRASVLSANARASALAASSLTATLAVLSAV